MNKLFKLILFLLSTSFLSVVACASYSADDEFREVVKKTNNLNVVPLSLSKKISVDMDNSDLESLQLVNFSNMNVFVKKTTTLKIAANLPSDNDIAPVGCHFYTISGIYDNLGKRHILTITWKKTAASQYSAFLSCPSANSICKDAVDDLSYTTNPLVVQFNESGQPVSFDGVATPPNIYINWKLRQTKIISTTETKAVPTLIKLNLDITSHAREFNIKKNKNNGRRKAELKNNKIAEKNNIYACFNHKVVSPTDCMPNI